MTAHTCNLSTLEAGRLPRSRLAWATILPTQPGLQDENLPQERGKPEKPSNIAKCPLGSPREGVSLCLPLFPHPQGPPHHHKGLSQGCTDPPRPPPPEEQGLIPRAHTAARACHCSPMGHDALFWLLKHTLPDIHPDKHPYRETKKKGDGSLPSSPVGGLESGSWGENGKPQLLPFLLLTQGIPQLDKSLHNW